MMEWRLTPLGSFSDLAYQPYVFVVVAALVLCGFLAGRSIMVFVRRFLPLALGLFIILPCLVLFDAEKHSGFFLFMSILVTIFSNIIWVVFSAALIELYAGKFWHYGLAAAIYFINIFLYISPPLARMIPDGTEYVVLTSGIAAAAFLLLSFRWFIVPKKSPPDHSRVVGLTADSHTSAKDLDATFRELGFSNRETEIATVLVREGLPTKEIAVRLNISVSTTNNHIASIYRKFGVKKRTEFMAMLLAENSENEQ
jgi:DNA-binding CsgD family transcriptional regulator